MSSAICKRARGTSPLAAAALCRLELCRGKYPIRGGQALLLEASGTLPVQAIHTSSACVLCVKCALCRARHPASIRQQVPLARKKGVMKPVTGLRARRVVPVVTARSRKRAVPRSVLARVAEPAAPPGAHLTLVTIIQCMKKRLKRLCAWFVRACGSLRTESAHIAPQGRPVPEGVACGADISAPSVSGGATPRHRSYASSHIFSAARL